MGIAMEYRNELKYLCSSDALEILRMRLNAIMEWDPHMGPDQQYNIRSIYFDDYYDSCMGENEAGVDERVKFRIRIYNQSPALIRLEAKYKKHGLTKKESTRISQDLCQRLMDGQHPELIECAGNKVLNLLYLNMCQYLMRPKVIVEYDRTVFVNQTGNVRITFDKNIRASKHVERFFEDNLYAIPVLETGMHILEIKYDELLPDPIAAAVELGNLAQTSFSKYYLSRRKVGGE